MIAAAESPNRRKELLRALGASMGTRLAFGLLVLLAIIFLSFLGLSMARGTNLGLAAGDALRSTADYLRQVAAGDLGESAAASINLRPVPVAEVVPDFLAKSLGLLAAAMLIAVPVGLSLGVLAARRRQGSGSITIIIASVIGVSVPSFFAALLLQLGVIRLTRLTGSPFLPVGGFGWDDHLILPALVLAARPIAQITRVSYLTIGDILDQDYVRTARSKGLWPRMVMLRHVARNAAIPILTTIGVSLRFALSSLPVVEFFFSWPGLGFNLLKSISQQDDNLTVILVLCLGALFILVNLLLELAFRLIDPRTRETPAHIEQGTGGGLLAGLSAFVRSLGELIRENPVSRLIQRRRRPAPALAQLRAGADESTPALEEPVDPYRGRRRRAWLRAAAGNLPLIVGGLLVFLLFVVLVFGADLAPNNPYTTQGLKIVDGEFIVPPFEPGTEYPWGTDVLGRDIMSLVLLGAQQTLYLATLVVLARLLVGFFLGALAGWLNGSWLDRLILGAAETVSAFPTLLLAMIFILALGIRQGLRPFVLSLCLVGWGEIMQLVRGEVTTLRGQPFIEGAVATGLRVPRILTAHVLPNLVPILTSIAALEMGAVLMLLGELGFIGIFIGGGSFAELDVSSQAYHYSDIPEWGALLSNVRPYARSYPWTALYPSLAFFLAILAFNLFGEGLRRVVARTGVGITRIFNRYTLALGLLAIVGVGWARANTGAVPFYREQAAAFEGQRALQHLFTLSQPSLQGRALGTPGLGMAADYIGRQMEAAGLQEAGEDLTYYQIRQRDFLSLDAQPALEFDDGGPDLIYRQDYAEYPDELRAIGEISGAVRFLAFGEIIRLGQFFGARIPALENLDFADEIVVVLSRQDLDLVRRVPRGGVLIVADDPTYLDRPATLSNQEPFFTLFGTNRPIGQDAPVLSISEAAADRLLAGSGYSVRELRRIASDLGQDEIIDLPTGRNAKMSIAGTGQEKVLSANVIGHIPGVIDSTLGGINDRMVVVMAQYDSPPPVPGDPPYLAANNNASGVAVLLEVMRAMQESGYQPWRTFLFVAYSGEGFEGGEPVLPEVTKFLQAKVGFSTSFEIEAVVELRGLGDGSGEPLLLSAGGNLRLANLFEQAADFTGTPVRRAEEQVDLSVVFEDRSLQAGGQEAPYIQVTREGWQTAAGLTSDNLAEINAEELDAAGETITLALMVLGRERQY